MNLTSLPKSGAYAAKPDPMLTCDHTLQVLGQNADMSDLQRIMLRSTKKMDDAQQQNMTVSFPGCQDLIASHSCQYMCYNHC